MRVRRYVSMSKRREHQQRLETTLLSFPPTDPLFLHVVAVKSRCPGTQVRTRVSFSEPSEPRSFLFVSAFSCFFFSCLWFSNR
jgi:hypothetical protein